MVGTDGSKFPAIHQHLDENIAGAYKDMDTSYVIQSSFLYSSHSIGQILPLS
jgi:hypothetical protein